MGFFDGFTRRSPRETFDKEYIDALRRSGEQRPVEFDDGEFSVIIKTVEGKAVSIRHLHNCHREYGKVPGDKRRAVIFSKRH